MRLRRELGEQAEKALLLAQERIAKLTQDLDHAMQRIQELEAADVARVAEIHEAQADMVRRSEEAKSEAAAEARASLPRRKRRLFFRRRKKRRLRARVKTNARTTTNLA